MWNKKRLSEIEPEIRCFAGSLDNPNARKLIRDALDSEKDLERAKNEIPEIYRNRCNSTYNGLSFLIEYNMAENALALIEEYSKK